MDTNEFYMPKHKLFLLDAMALLYRAHFAFIKNPRKTSKGLDTSAIFGFTNTLMEIISKEDPTHLAVAFDGREPTFRHKEFPEYKGHREAMPEDLRAGIPYAYKLLEALNIPALLLEGYEADDIIGTIAHRMNPDEFDVYMVTPDKDYAQLVKENVFLYKPAYKGGGFDVMGAAEVEEKFGLPPSQIIDFLGLKGDASDNIPGVPKIGDKTAVSLLKEYGTVENLLEHREELTKKSIKATLTEFGDQGLLSKRLATILLEVPIECTIEDLKIGYCDLEALQALMQELEFRNAANRILNSKLNPMRGDGTRGIDGEDMDIRDFQTDAGPKTIENTEHTYQALNTPEERHTFIQKIKDAGEFCFDTETTGLDPLQAELVGIALALTSGEAYYVPTPADPEEAKAIAREFKEVLESEEITKIGQNLKYDILVMRKYDIFVKGPMFDTMLAHYVSQTGF